MIHNKQMRDQINTCCEEIISLIIIGLKSYRNSNLGAFSLRYNVTYCNNVDHIQQDHRYVYIYA